MDVLSCRRENCTAEWISRAFLTTLIILLPIAGCRTPQSMTDRAYVDAELQHRVSHEIASDFCPGEVLIPPCVDLADGLSEDEAVALALWNNRDFLSTLANLGIARGDLVQAGLLTNPQLNILFPPIGSKQLEWTLFVPLEALILRKQRVEIAERDFQRIAEELVQNGLNVARDARVAFADFEFATARYALAESAVEIRGGIADLARKRHEAGDIGELEVVNTRIDANRSRAEAAGLKQAVNVAEARLKNILGIAILDETLNPVPSKLPSKLSLDPDSLISEALLIRPDFKAARFAIDAANHRVKLARKSFLRIDAVADGNHSGAGPSNVGPGLRFEIPIFNRNQGLVIRSEWTVDQASHNYYSIRDRIITEVKTSLGSVEQANANLQLLQTDVLPPLEDTVQLAEKAYEGGGEGYFLVLQSTSQFLDSRIRELELIAALRRAIAELDRSVGRHGTTMPAVNDIQPEAVPLPQGDVDNMNQPGPVLPPANASLVPNSPNGSETTPNVMVIVIQQTGGTDAIRQDTIAESLQQAAKFMIEETKAKQGEPVVPSSFLLDPQESSE